VAAYEEYMADGSQKDKDGERMGAYGKYILGSEDYVRKIKLVLKDKKLAVEIANRQQLKQIIGPETIVKAAAEYYGKKEDEFKYKKSKWNPGRKVLIYLLARDAGMKNTEIAKYLGHVHHSGIGKLKALVGREVLVNGKRTEEVKIEEKYLKLSMKSCHVSCRGLAPFLVLPGLQKFFRKYRRRRSFHSAKVV
jgi:hypothetical protein